MILAAASFKTSAPWGAVVTEGARRASAFWDLIRLSQSSDRARAISFFRSIANDSDNSCNVAPFAYIRNAPTQFIPVPVRARIEAFLTAVSWISDTPAI